TLSEDCLYLNVYTPAANNRGRRPRPVIVWIHGGGLAIDASRNYDPTQLAAEGTVVVTINYRLGALGALAHSGAGLPAGRPGRQLRHHGPANRPEVGATQHRLVRRRPARRDHRR